VNGHLRGRGFTLIEVLVALMIVALGMGAVLSALSSAADSTIRLREKTFATWVGLNQLAATRLKQTFPSKGKTEGDVDLANSRWHWQQEVEVMQIPGLRRITIQVRYADTASDRGPATGKAMSDRSDWLATVSGFRGDAISPPQGTLQGWP
jgi:general secretion pathway protein I